MNLTLAQLDAVPAEHLKWTAILVFAALLAGSAVLGTWAMLRKRTVSIEPQPQQFEKVPKRFSKELCDEKHEEINRRLTGHDAEINSLWNTVRIEDEITRTEMRKGFLKMERALGRIEGHLGTNPEGNA